MSGFATSSPSESTPARSPDRVVVEHPQRSPVAVVLKRCVLACFHVWVLPRVLCYRLLCTIWGPGRAHLAASESIARIPGVRGVFCRQAFYRWTLAHCGQDVSFGWMSTLSMPEARIGDRAYIGRHCSLGFADVGPGVMLADGVQILSGGREHGRAGAVAFHQDQPQEFRRVTVGQGAWIGAGAIIMADVGEHAIVGAGAVVTQPIPARAVAVGVPAKVVRMLDAQAPSGSPSISSAPRDRS